MTEDLRVVCDQCGGGNIEHRRKSILPIRQVKLTAWVQEVKTLSTEPAPLRLTEMVAECQACHFTVEYDRFESS